MFDLIQKNLPEGGIFCQYGPFNVNGDYTSDSNRDFNQYLISQGCGGLWDIADLQVLVSGLDLLHQYALPANNKLLIWQKC